MNISVLSTAADGIEAFEFIKNHEPDIVLTDIRMPRCDGLTLIEKVSNLKLNTKFIIISGYDDFKYAQMAIRYGVKSYLLKPIKKEELIIEVKSVCNQIIAEQQLNNTTFKKSSIILMGNDALREKFFSRLLQNEYKQENEILDEIETYTLGIQNKPLQVIVFTYELSDSTNNSAFLKKDGGLFKYAVKNIIEEILGNTSSETFEYENSYIVSIINTHSLQDNNILVGADFCNQCIKTIKDYMNISIYVGIGNVVDSLLSTNQSYRIALESLAYKIYETPQRVFDSSAITYTDIPNISANDMDNSDLIDAIYRGNQDDMLTFITNFFHSVFFNTTPPPNFIRGMCIYLVIDVQKGLSVYMDESNDLFTEQPYVVINNLPFFSQIKEWIITLFTTYINHIKKTCKYKKDPIIEKAKAYINANIFRKLKADEVATHVNLSENYFTVYFKEKTHENFLNYVLSLKIEHAKNLLKTSNKTISEISFLLGYEDYRSFNRLFKRSTEKTPSEFRHLYSNEN